MTLANLLVVARAMESTERQTKVIELGNTPAVAAVRPRDNKHQRPWQHVNIDSSKRTASSKQTCRNCGKNCPHAGGRESCPAFGKNCSACTKPNHFVICCRSKKPQEDKPSQNQTTTTYRPRLKNVREVHDETADNTSSDDSNGYAFIISNKMKDRQRRTKIKINGVYFSFSRMCRRKYLRTERIRQW